MNSQSSPLLACMSDQITSKCTRALGVSKRWGSRPTPFPVSPILRSSYRSFFCGCLQIGHFIMTWWLTGCKQDTGMLRLITRKYARRGKKWISLVNRIHCRQMSLFLSVMAHEIEYIFARAIHLLFLTKYTLLAIKRKLYTGESRPITDWETGRDWEGNDRK